MNYWSRDMLNFNFSEKGLRLVSPPTKAFFIISKELSAAKRCLKPENAPLIHHFVLIAIGAVVVLFVLFGKIYRLRKPSNRWFLYSNESRKAKAVDKLFLKFQQIYDRLRCGSFKWKYRLAFVNLWELEGALSGLRQLLTTESPLKMIKNALFHLKSSVRSQDI